MPDCRHCGAWENKPGDRFCGLCGKPLFDRQRVLTPVGGGEARGGLQLHNPAHGVSTFHIKSPDWLRFELAAGALPDGSRGYVVELQPNGRLDVGFEVVGENLGGCLSKMAFVAIYQDGRLSREVRIELYRAPRSLRVEDIKLYLADQDKDLWIISTDAPFTVAAAEFTCERPGLELRMASATVDLEIGRTPLPVEVSATETGAYDVGFRLVASKRDGGFELEGRFEVAVKHHPCVAIDTASVTAAGKRAVGRDVKPDERGAMAITIRNAGEEPLDVRRLLLSPRSDKVVWPEDVPAFKLEPGQTRDIAPKYRLSPMATGDVVTDLRFDANDPTTPQFEVVLRVKEEVYHGFLAIDYGTSTSSAAYCVDQAQSVILEDRNAKATSDVYFFSHQPAGDPPYDYAIGRESEGWGVDSWRRRAAAAKTRLGRSEPFEIELSEYSHHPSPELVARMALLELVRFARAGLGMRPDGVFYTVPTRFTLRQERILGEVIRGVLQEKGLDRVRLVSADEAFAAGFYYLHEGVLRDPDLCCRPEYTLMVMDIGGGTTDVTMFRVEQAPGAEQQAPVVNRVEVLGAWGDQHLGGYALSTRIAEHIASQAGLDTVDVRPAIDTAERVKYVLSEYLKLAMLREPGPNAARLKPDRDLLARALASLETGSVDRLSDVKGLPRNELDKRVEQIRRTGSVRVLLPAALGAKELNIKLRDIADVVKLQLTGFVQEMKEMMRRSGEERVDKLLLCGQSTLLPIVPEMFAQVSECWDYVRGPDGGLLLKEAVSLGGAKYANWQYDVEVIGSDRFWRILGKPAGVFRELVPWGTQRPHEVPLRFSRKFSVVEDEESGAVLQFTLSENLTLRPGQTQLADFETFEISIDGAQDQYFDGKLVLTQGGEIEVYCKLGGTWQRMQPKPPNGGA